MVVVGDAAVVVITESKAVSIFGSLIASKLARGGTGQCAQGLAHDGWRVLHVAFSALVSVLECCDLPVGKEHSSVPGGDAERKSGLRRVDIQLRVILPGVDDLALHECLGRFNV